MKEVLDMMALNRDHSRDRSNCQLVHFVCAIVVIIAAFYGGRPVMIVPYLFVSVRLFDMKLAEIDKYYNKEYEALVSDVM